MKDIAKRFKENPLLSPSDIPASREGLEITCLLNPGVFQFDNKTWLVVRVAERPQQKENVISFPILTEKGAIKIIEIAKDDPDLIATDARVINYKGVYQIEKIIEKPSVSLAELELQTPGLRAGYYLCFFGMHVFKPFLFELLGNKCSKTDDNHILLTPVLQELAKNDKYLAMEMKGNRFDTSKKLGLMEAQIALGLSGNTRDEVLSSIIQILAESGKQYL